MNQKKKAQLKDEIIRLTSNPATSLSIYELCDKLKVEVKLIAYLSEELGKEELLKLTEVAPRHNEVPKEYIVSRTIKGIYFLNFDGGHIVKYRKHRLKRNWIIIKTVAAIINALAILAIGAYTIYLSNKTNKLEIENEKLKVELKMNAYSEHSE